MRECLALRQEELEPGDWLISSIKSTLGFCLTAQGRFEEAEPLVVDGYGGIRSNPLAPPERRQEAQERVVSLYEKWDKPQEAARWRDGVQAGTD